VNPLGDIHGTLSVGPERAINLKHDIPRRIEITDGTLALVAKGFGELRDLKLPAGVYQARVETQRKPFERMVFVRPGKTTSISYPVADREVLPSPAPIPGSNAMHESLRKKTNPAVLEEPAKASRVFVMATHAGVGGREIDFSRFRLLDPQGVELGSMAKDWQPGDQGRSKQFCLDVDQGGFVLEGVAEGFGPDIRIRQPIYCSPRWVTLIFMGANAGTGTPDLNSASIYLWPVGLPFAPERREAPRIGNFDAVLRSQRATELALHSLVTGRKLFSPDDMDVLLHGKFRNPMLGVLGCHLLLQQQSKNAGLIRTVLGNLDGLLPHHPDVIALKALARRAGIKLKGPDARIVSWPPMLREGFRALRDADWAKPGIVQPDSLFDRVRTRVVAGGAWTRWIVESGDLEFAPAEASTPRGPKRVATPRARAQALGIAVTDILSYLKLFDPNKVHATDFMASGMSRRQASAATALVKASPRSRAGRMKSQKATPKKVKKVAKPSRPTGKSRVKKTSTSAKKPKGILKAAPRPASTRAPRGRAPSRGRR
jgi:hypothetical protein